MRLRPWQACWCLTTLTDGNSEKVAASATGIVPRLVAFIAGMQGSDDEQFEASTRVATAASAALMSLTTENACKAIAVKAGAVRVLAELVGDPAAQAELSEQMGEDCGYAPLVTAGGPDDRDAQRRVHATGETLIQNVTKCIANLAEHPVARKKLSKGKGERTALSELVALGGSTKEPLLMKNVAIAIEKVTWTP